ncbi:hypothetical protein HZA40_04540, partial [Candidatus Peregrinibacteria bacterium]|nr:hypothetical protein [Candidatus Peregrinibacteria bacterium]
RALQIYQAQIAAHYQNHIPYELLASYIGDRVNQAINSFTERVTRPFKKPKE